MKTQILNSKGETIVLNAREAFMATMLQDKYNREVKNALGYEVDITTLTAISKRVVEQKFFQIAPADYMPVRVGENAWSTEILTYRGYQLGGDFESGIINTGASNSRLAEADAGVDTLTNKIVTWAKEINWSFADLQFAAKSGNWDLVTEKERARKRNWDLGIQAISFLGSKSDAKVLGLLTQTTVNANTAVITALLNGLNAADFGTFVETVIEDYRSNAARTVYPNQFIIPEADFNGLAVLTPGTVGTYPVSKLEYLLQAFKLITRNANFKIMPCAYCDKANNTAVTGLNKNRYVLMNYDEDSGRMDIPVDYTNTMQNTINGFQFQNTGFGQFTGYLAYRPLEMRYYDWG